MSATYRYCGRDFSASGMTLVAELCQDAALPTRASAARELCARLGWVDAMGRPKAMSARVALIRMEADGLVALPPSAANNANRRWPLRGNEKALSLPSGEPPADQNRRDGITEYVRDGAAVPPE